LKSGIWLTLPDFVRRSFDRKDYLAGFSDELLVKSSRIDLLIRHTGTVGSYREELLRNLLRQILPKRYEASTGFISGCARQIDIIIWDAEEYLPLFRDRDVVVVPRAAVRGVIEVKTKLETKTLDESMSILFDVFRNQQNIAPIFKGVFAYESEYASEKTIAARMQEIYLSKEPDNIIEHAHSYLFEGVTAVCVPNKSFVFQQYIINREAPQSFPYPALFTIASEWPGDVKMAAFLSQMLDHLELAKGAKESAAELFRPISRELKGVHLLDIFGQNWTPTSAVSQLAKTLEPEGARNYVLRVEQFFDGILGAAEIAVDLRKER
jgi:hypothetical protein